MAIKKDLSNQRFGRLTALYPIQSLNGRSRWHCVCDCGNTCDVLQQNLTNAHVRSCGCLLKERNHERISAYNTANGKQSHNETKSRLYRIWIGIKSRCLCETATDFKNYGGRGISICDEWKDDFLAFKRWANSHGYADSLTIDRIDVDGDYSPDNCRWVSQSIQQFNKRIMRRNTSGHIGVSFNKKSNAWVAYISKDHKTKFLGAFTTFEDAVSAREKAVAELYLLDK